MKTVIKNIGAIVSGDLNKPMLTGDTILIADEALEERAWFQARSRHGRLTLQNWPGRLSVKPDAPCRLLCVFREIGAQVST